MIDFIPEVDWKALQSQKANIIDALNNRLSYYDIIDDLDAVVSLLDSIQDYAVDTLGMDENVVFNLKDDETD